MSERLKPIPPFKPSRYIGEKITWMAVNGPVSGVIDAFLEGGYLVCIDNGREMVLRDESIIEG